MTKFVLIAVLSLGFKFGSASVVAEFDDQAACTRAKELLLASHGMTNPSLGGVAICAPKTAAP